MSRHPHPPRLARAMASLLIRGDAREVIVGDLDQEFADAIAGGVTPAAARRLYWRQTIASIYAVHQRSGETMTIRGVARLWQGLSLDLKSVWRALRRSPGYAAVAILSLAIGIGANTAIVSVARQVLLDPLPVPRPNDIKLVYWQPPRDGKYSTMNLNSTGYRDAAGVQFRSNYTYPEFAAMNDAVKNDTLFAGYNSLRQLTVTAGTRAPIVTGGMIVSGRYFDTLQPRLVLGRGISNSDDQPGAPLVAVISDQFWSTYFGRDPAVVGGVMNIGDAPATIVGVTARGYRGLSPSGFGVDADVTVPMAAQTAVAPEWTDGVSLFADREQHWIRAIARVPASRETEVTGRLTAAFRGAATGSHLTPSQIAESAPVLLAAPRGADSLRLTAAQPLRILIVVVGIVLLIACTNVAGLMLARGVARQRELAVRRALGASGGRLIRELLVESLMLSLCGGVAGVLLAFWSAPAFQSMLTAGLGTRGVTIVVDGRTLAMTFGIAVGTGILAGLIPAMRLGARRDAAVNDRGSAGAPKLLIGRVLLAIQIAISMPLVAGAGLLLRTLHNLGNIELGFNPQSLVLFDADPTLNGRFPERSATVYPRLLSRIEEIPGVSSATYIENALISGFESDSDATLPDGSRISLFINRVGPHYFETMGTRLLAGRAIDERDRKDSARVGVVNETAARLFFGNASPIGQQIKLGQRYFEIVGLFADAKYDSLKAVVRPTMLQTYQQSQTYGRHIVVRTSLAPEAFRAALTTAIHDVDPNLPFTQFKTQTQQIDESIGRERVFSQLLTIFGVFALLLACIGLHGVTSYAVTRRTGEIGIRLALGAQRSHVLWMILRQVVALAMLGLAVGVPGALLAGPAVRSLLYGLSPSDPWTIGGAALVMVVVATTAGWLPARRAAKMEALAALRSE